MNRLPALQILRGIAASLVVVDHSILRHAEWADYPAIVIVAAQYSGTLGVAVFFVISGYIMIHTAGSEFGRPGAPAAFLRRRIIRIVPLYWLATVLEVALRLRKGGSLDLQDLLSSLFFIPQAVVSGEYMRPLLGVGWTLNYEMFFYCIFAVALFFGRAVGLALLFSALFGLVAFGAMFKSIADTSQPLTVVHFLTDPIILLFAAGVAVGLVLRPARLHAVITHPVIVATTLLSAYAAVFLLAVGSYPIPLAWQTGAWAVCIATVALCVAGRQADASAIQRAGTQLGDTSYALYLFHFFAVVAAEKIWWLLFGKDPSILFILAAFLISVLASYAVHHLVEVKIAQLLTGRSGRTRSELSMPNALVPEENQFQPAPTRHR